MEITSLPLGKQITLTVNTVHGPVFLQGQLHARGGKALDFRPRRGHGARRLVHQDDIISWASGYAT